MGALVAIGTAVTLLGLCGLACCVVLAVRARRAGLDDAAMAAALRRVVTLNMASLGVAALGLACVVTGALLG